MQVTSLKAYLATIDMTFRKFAEMVECSPAYLSSVARGKRIPKKRIANNILRLTNGTIDITKIKKPEDSSSEGCSDL